MAYKPQSFPLICVKNITHSGVKEDCTRLTGWIFSQRTANQVLLSAMCLMELDKQILSIKIHSSAISEWVNSQISHFLSLLGSLHSSLMIIPWMIYGWH